MDNAHVVCLTNLFDKNGLSTEVNVLVVIDETLTGNDLETVTAFFSKRGTISFTYAPDINKSQDMYGAVLSGVIGNIVPCDMDLISAYTKRLVPGGLLIVKTDCENEENTVKRLKMCGVLDVAASGTPGIVVGRTPSYKVGSSDKVTLNLANKENVISAWKLDDDDSETIIEDDLLEADDLKKPESSSLRVCATTKKAKACKDCSCGLAEELEANRQKEAPKPDTSNAKSSCGSCYLGDAFRCASCPYLGMPAFKPGEKVQLTGTLLQDDF